MVEPAYLRIRRITVKKLFGLYDHEINLNLGERVTIIHGPNGVGKTVILKLLAALFAGRVAEFRRIPLDRFDVDLSDGTTLSLSASSPVHSDDGAQPSHGNSRWITVVRDGIKLHAWVLNHRQSRVEEDEEDGAAGPSNELFHSDNRKESPAIIKTPEPPELTAIRARVNVHLIDTQRLFRVDSRRWGSSLRRTPGLVAVVQDYADALKESINAALATYGRESESLDQTFPQRLLKSAFTPLDKTEIRRRLDALDERRHTLKNLGLLDDARAHPFALGDLDNLNPTQLGVMSLYVQDTEQKLSVLDALADRIGVLGASINGKFKNKSIRFDRTHGFTIIGSDGQPLRLETLSSGEQHELVLLYDLIFRVQPNALVLLDEPELSLHVLWQKRFLPELLQIVKTAQFDALIATHSPFIVGDRHDLMVALAAEDA